MRIVVDASVAKAAGAGRPDAGPPSPACVRALDAIAKHPSLRVATSWALKQEWDRHGRAYASKWLATQLSRKRVHIERTTWEGEVGLIDAAQDLPGRGGEAVAKDAHLVGLAMLTDRRVLSLDDQQRGLLEALAPRLPALTTLHWASPKAPETLPWLDSGAPEDPAIQIHPTLRASR